MPVYEIRCNTCGNRFETILNFAQAVLKQECPLCHSRDTEKHILEPIPANGPVAWVDSSCGTDDRST